MLMARKAACFVDCLEELGLLSLNGFVTTNRVLDMDTTWFRRKNVLIVDEALISGTTLYETRKQILAIGAKSVDFRLLCINKRTHSKALVRYNKPCLRLSELETTSLCLEIVEAISLMPHHDDYRCFGYVVGIQAEWTYFYLSELEKICIRGYRIKRDLSIHPARFSKVIKQFRNNRGF